ncbi:MAG: aminotransferase class I/II-fold pyridoxal phosphate-dependent enzyme [Burkholderiaceae bacterium]
MPKFAFLDDYSEGCHPQILKALESTNAIQQAAYGDDAYCIEARRLIAAQLQPATAAIHFVPTGTMANLLCIAACLKPYEAVISASSGHIALREAGAVEATGHKIITVPGTNGKLTPADVQRVLDSNAHFPHMARPRMLYISNATEYGTVYRRSELQALASLCRQKDLLLMIDGARIGAALSCSASDVSLADIASFADIFWIGGTKAGAMFGEAIVIGNRKYEDDIGFHIKQRGAMLAKGRVLGVQFAELFRDGLFFDLAAHANAMATQLSAGIVGAGYSLAAETESNQVFPLLPDRLIEALREQFDFHTWEGRDDGQSVIRLVTSWATDAGQVKRFIGHLKPN